MHVTMCENVSSSVCCYGGVSDITPRLFHESRRIKFDSYNTRVPRNLEYSVSREIWNTVMRYTGVVKIASRNLRYILLYFINFVGCVADILLLKPIYVSRNWITTLLDNTTQKLTSSKHIFIQVTRTTVLCIL
jgi:hypothetical protein